jgi:hypothetical protein
MADVDATIRPAAAAPALGVARAKLRPVERREPLWGLLGAAGLAAGAALCLAAVVILGPPHSIKPRQQVDVNPWVR